MTPFDMTEVLDHGFVRLVSSMGDDEAIVRNARVSFAANEKTGKDPAADAKLINFLYDHGHNTPFESVEFQFHVKAPIFVVRQWHRHRTWSYNEVSARYTALPREFYVPKVDDIGQQSLKNRQARDLAMDPEALEYRLNEVARYRVACNKQFQLYDDLLKCGWPRELARAVLPVSTYTEMFAKVDLSNLFKFLHERLDPHAQYEIRVYAQAMLDLIRPVVPVAVEAFMKKRCTNS
jgi:thymidylate synthase (FAD)